MSYRDRSTEPFWTQADQVIDIYLYDDSAQATASSEVTTCELKITDFGGTTTYTGALVSASSAFWQVTLDSSYHSSPGDAVLIVLADGIPKGHAKVVRFAENP